MLDDVHSAYLAQWLKKKIRAHDYYHYKLRLLANCMHYAPPTRGVQVISNGDMTKILGPRACNNSWACPECTAKQMRKYSTRIAAALDALREKGLAATMFTLTIFHTAMMDCEESFFLLRKAWEIMDKQKTWRRKKKDGSYYVNAGIWSQFHNEFQFTHHVKTLEVTYGSHGWHPHIHMLIWFKKDDLQKLADWEEKLNECWADAIDKAAKILYKNNQKSYEVRKFLESKTDRADSQHLGLHISKVTEGKNAGKIKEWKSGDYLCGWGGNNELTGLGMKLAHNDNMTPFQMLEKAAELETTDICQSNRLLELYLHFAWTVLKNRILRIQFSRTGLKAIIDTHLQTEKFKAVLKKKKESLKLKAFQNIAWFSSKQWQDICSLDNPYFIPLLKHFAKVPDTIFKDRYDSYEVGYINAFELICELCIANNISPPLCVKHPVIDFAQAFNELVLPEYSAA